MRPAQHGARSPSETAQACPATPSASVRASPASTSHAKAAQSSPYHRYSCVSLREVRKEQEPRRHLTPSNSASPRLRASTSTPRKDRTSAHAPRAAPVGSKQRQRRRGAGVRPRQGRRGTSCPRRRHSNRKILSKLHKSRGARSSAKM